MIAIVTGGTRGIGLAITKKLLEIGYSCLVCARTKSAELLEICELYPNKIDFLSCDISNSIDRANITNYIQVKYQSIDLLVNNAGVAPKVRKDILEITEEDYDYLLDINLRGTFFLTQSIAKIMQHARSGRIINISSISSYTASINRAEYCIAKAGISMTTKLFAAKLAEYGIGVFEIMPGIIETDMINTVKEKYTLLVQDGLTPMTRLGTPKDVANCVASIVSGNLDFCTGTVINADGGYSIRRL